MKATIPYIEQKFEEFNQQMFAGQLPKLPIELSDAKTFLGVCAFKTRKDKDGKNVVLPRESLTASGTSYSKEFADVLKKIFGHIPDSGPLSGAIL